MDFKYNKSQCRDGMEKPCLENLLASVRCDMIVKKEIEELKNEIVKRELKLEEIADARSQIFTIHEQLHNETQLPLWSPFLGESIGKNLSVSRAVKRRLPPHTTAAVACWWERTLQKTR